MRLHPLIAVYNESSVLTDAAVQAALPAFKYCADHHFEPLWNGTCAFKFVAAGEAPPTVSNPDQLWELHILDDSDQAGALGYHWLTDTGTPLLRVFAATDAEYGLSWTVTATHEIWEALADPRCARAIQVSNTQFYALEVGDPVENDDYAYEYDGVKISNFITEEWFDNTSDGPYDKNQLCKSPLQVLQGGYVSICVASNNTLKWTQNQMRQGQLVTVPLDETDPRYRNRNESV